MALLVYFRKRTDVLHSVQEEIKQLKSLLDEGRSENMMRTDESVIDPSSNEHVIQVDTKVCTSGFFTHSLILISDVALLNIHIKCMV